MYNDAQMYQGLYAVPHPQTKRNVNYTYIPFRHACDHQYFLPGEICDQLAKIREGEIYTEASGSLP